MAKQKDIKLVKKKDSSGNVKYQKKQGGKYVSDKAFIKQEIEAGRANNLKRTNYFKSLPKNLKLSFYANKRVKEGKTLQNKGKFLSKKQIDYITDEAKRMGKPVKDVIDFVLSVKKPPQIKQVRSLWQLYSQSNGKLFDVQDNKAVLIPEDIVPDYILNIEEEAEAKAARSDSSSYITLYTVRIDYDVKTDIVDIYVLDYEVIPSGRIKKYFKSKAKKKGR
jgi:hypothetical protein